MATGCIVSVGESEGERRYGITVSSGNAGYMNVGFIRAKA